MSVIRLRDNVYSVGVQDPARRICDIVMPIRFGTTYNAFLITGESNILMEAVPDEFFAEYLENISAVVPLESLDYLILNHAEPDQSGCVGRLLTLCPDLKVICTATAKRLLEGMLNDTVSCIPVRDGDRMEFGDRELVFIGAPMLHWADTMFTWLPRERVLFTGDFLGCHFAQPSLLDTFEHHKAEYREELARYFATLFGPFRPYVLAGLDRMPLEAELVCPTHGPCLTGTIAAVKEQYKLWSTRPLRTKRTAAVLYCSAYGATERLACAMADTLRERGMAVTLTDVSRVPDGTAASLANSVDLLLVGAPTINRDAPRPIWEVLCAVDAINTRNRVAAAFGSYGWSGEACQMLHHRLSELGFTTPRNPFGVVLTPSEEDLNTARAYITNLAGMVR